MSAKAHFQQLMHQSFSTASGFPEEVYCSLPENHCLLRIHLPHVCCWSWIPRMVPHISYCKVGDDNDMQFTSYLVHTSSSVTNEESCTTMNKHYLCGGLSLDLQPRSTYPLSISITHLLFIGEESQIRMLPSSPALTTNIPSTHRHSMS